MSYSPKNRRLMKCSVCHSDDVILKEIISYYRKCLTCEYEWSTNKDNQMLLKGGK